MLIGLTGRMGAGKDTVALRIQTLLPPGWGYEHLSFAAPLKQSVAALFDISVERVEEWKTDDAPFLFINEPGMKMTMREVLQRYGTEAHRDVFGTDFWVTQTMSKISPSPSVVSVITDVRFPNEAAAIRRAGGRVIEVVGLGGRMDPEAEHASERGVGEVDGLLDNVVRGDNYVTLDANVYPLLFQGPPRDLEKRKEFVRDLRSGLLDA